MVVFSFAWHWVWILYWDFCLWWLQSMNFCVFFSGTRVQFSKKKNRDNFFVNQEMCFFFLLWRSGSIVYKQIGATDLYELTLKSTDAQITCKYLLFVPSEITSWWHVVQLNYIDTHTEREKERNALSELDDFSKWIF